MTDKEQLIAMLERAKIKFETKGLNPTRRKTIIKNADGSYSPGVETADQPGSAIIVEGGYMGFYTDFTFDEAGNLLTIGAYE